MSRLAFASLALLASPVPAAAQEPAGPRSYEAISVTELNLATPAGRATLDARLTAAANRVCGMSSVSNWQETMDARSCRRINLSDARRQVRRAMASRSLAAQARVTVASR